MDVEAVAEVVADTDSGQEMVHSVIYHHGRDLVGYMDGVLVGVSDIGPVQVQQHHHRLVQQQMHSLCEIKKMCLYNSFNHYKKQ
jgi:hypothetical protein